MYVCISSCPDACNEDTCVSVSSVFLVLLKLVMRISVSVYLLYTSICMFVFLVVLMLVIRISLFVYLFRFSLS